MPIVIDNQYHSWMKSAADIKRSSDESVLRITYEGLAKFQSFMDFYRDSIESLSKSCCNNIDRIFADVHKGD